MSDPKRQHFLAQVFLSNFTNENGQIYMLDGKKNKISSRNPASIAKEKHLYTVFEGGKKNFLIEKHFSEIESNIKPLLEKIVLEGLSSISDAEVIQLIGFVILTFMRTPNITQVAEEIMRDPKVLESMRAINKNEADKYIADCLATKGLSYASTLKQNLEHRHKIIVHNFDAFLLTAEEGSVPFALNDRSMSMETIDNQVYYKGEDVDWSKMRVKKHFPVSNRHCVSFVPKSDPERYGTNTIRIERRVISSRDVDVINLLTLLQKYRYAYCADDHPMRANAQ